MIVLYIGVALLNWTVAGLYASDSRWGLAAVWLATGAIWLVGAYFWAQTRRIRQETDRIIRGLR